ncbi:MAG: Molybdopterin molybdenumtransferase [Candidatus Heimdallarchaeota archaeon LC_2]|nr:MAG: Molybdopterin molybdenumtransferase [Candidatus Heimdallarchaeota archaeon LC_2]
MSARGRGFSNIMRVEEIKQLVQERVLYNPNSERISSIQALDRVLAEDIISKVNLPGFRRSAMDGFAVLASSTFGASDTSPIRLKISGQVEIGDKTAPILQTGNAIRISTGAPIPQEADAVIKIEDCELITDLDLDVMSAVNSGTNIANEDEDIKINELVLPIGTLIRPWDIAIFESIGQNQIIVYCLPKISVLSTGNELVTSGSIPNIGEVVDSNRPAINAWLTKFNVNLVKSESCLDDIDLLKEKIIQLAVQSDLIITTGGTSVGTKDYLPEIIVNIGELFVHGCAIRPGKPVAIGFINTESKRKVPIIALPGYPLAAFINFELFVASLLSNWTKIEIPWQNQIKVKLKTKIPSQAGVRDFVRLKETSAGAEVIRITGAGILSSLVHADYMLEVPEDIEGYSAGDIVSVKKLR